MTEKATTPTKTPKISVIERRLQSQSALQEGSVALPLTDSQWVVRWENSQIRPDHLWHVINVLGWEYAEPSDLACPLEEVGAVARDNRVVRGERGSEVLVKMRASHYTQLQWKKAQENLKRISPTKTKSTVAEAVGQTHGDQAAAFIEGRMNVRDSRERVTDE